MRVLLCIVLAEELFWIVVEQFREAHLLVKVGLDKIGLIEPSQLVRVYIKLGWTIRMISHPVFSKGGLFKLLRLLRTTYSHVLLMHTANY